MSSTPIELTEAFLIKVGGWEAIGLARGLLSSGKVLSSNWTPPTLRGVVQSDDTSYRAGLIIKDSINIDNLCTCRASRQWGTICAHSIAVGLHVLKGASPTPAPGSAGPASAQKAGTLPPGNSRPAIRTKDPAKLPRSSPGVPLQVHVLFPPRLDESISKGRIMLVFEGISSRGRGPLNGLLKHGPFQISEITERLLTAAESLCGGDTPGMAQFTLQQLVELLPFLAGHPNTTLGRDTFLRVLTDPISLPLRATLTAEGEIQVAVRSGARPPILLNGPDQCWCFQSSPAELRPLAMSASLRECLVKPLRIPRPQVPNFLLNDWKALEASGNVEANFTQGDFILEPQAPRIHLHLAGGLAQLTGTLQCAYGARILPLGLAPANEAPWVPDPANPKRYGTRDLLAEHNALMRFRQSGFSGPNAQGHWQMVGQDRVLAFFAREYPRMERDWSVTLEERLERSTQNNLERVTPQFSVTPSGEQWFDLGVSYDTSGGERLSQADIQQLLLGNGSKRLRNGKWAIMDTGAVEELQQVLLDCAPRQQLGTEGTTFRMSNAQASFLDTTLSQQGFEIRAPQDWRSRAATQRGETQLSCPDLGPLNSVLRDYQKSGVAWLQFLRANAFGGVLADEMGLGKTVQILAHLAAVQRSKPSPKLPHLVICPTSLVSNWANEAAKFTPELKVLALHGNQRHALLQRIPESDLVITSYGLIRRDFDRYQTYEFDSVILDEAQHIKNRQTQNAQAVKLLRSQRRIVLTGTPLENSVLDLWSLFDFLMPGYLGSAKDFRERYEVPIAREKDKASMDRLARRVRPFLLRRRKSEVAKELPPKIEQVAFCDLTEDQSAVYQQLLSATRQEITDAVGAQGLAKSRMLVLTALLRLRQICCDLRLLKAGEFSSEPAPELAPGEPAQPAEDTLATSGKLQLFAELLDEALDGGHRILVFSQFTSMLSLLRQHLDGRGTPFAYLDGSTSNRQAVVKKFQEDPGIPVFLISLKAGGVGLNLTGADTVIHFDPWWNPAVEDQATDRAHRIGQTRVVTSYKLITRNTVEEKILNLQKRKRELIAAALTGEESFTESLSWDEIQELLG